jgi:small conductance mechanosensitive channel
MRSGPQAAHFSPGVQARLLLYHPVVTVALRLTIYLLSILGLLQLYGLNTFLWLLESALGLRILSASGTLLVTIILAFGVWEAINLGVQQHLDRLQRETQLAKSARLRTLLPLLRSTLLITIAVVAGLMILSQIGINIAPLLAGAGIIGVAIGFGSQKLVQDLITGIFLLLENAMQVGDVVSVGGLSGVVESLSVRTIRLRSEDGSVFIIPFSSVTTVTNMTKDYSRAVIVAGVAYKEDYDRVVEVLKAISQEMRDETAWKPIILDDLEVWGLDQFGESAVTIKCRIMCTPFGRWSVLREFNRRMKARFDDLGIEIPFPHRKLVMEAMPAVVAAGSQETPDDKRRAAD